MRTQLQKAEAFRALHARPGVFIIPNPWDVGTARILERLGFEALATTSAGFAFSHGVPDNRVSRDAMLAHVAQLTTATNIPVSADLENGYGDDVLYAPCIITREEITAVVRSVDRPVNFLMGTQPVSARSANY